MSVELHIGDVVSGMFRRRKVKRKIDMVAKGMVYFIDQNQPACQQVLEKVSMKAFNAWYDSKCTSHMRNGVKIDHHQ